MTSKDSLGYEYETRLEYRRRILESLRENDTAMFQVSNGGGGVAIPHKKARSENSLFSKLIILTGEEVLNVRPWVGDILRNCYRFQTRISERIISYFVQTVIGLRGMS